MKFLGYKYLPPLSGVMEFTDHKGGVTSILRNNIGMIPDFNKMHLYMKLDNERIINSFSFSIENGLVYINTRQNAFVLAVYVQGNDNAQSMDEYVQSNPAIFIAIVHVDAFCIRGVLDRLGVDLETDFPKIWEHIKLHTICVNTSSSMYTLAGRK